ncbi:hypothetical protein DER46DRAFT_581683 [Fusarium sp. MPI-SDFR-AT-0072]|nr:hypothetical protein DER46DRAFT_581683 [Fusarium sp. MPI-SDFR-AT-0072]
MPVAYWLIARVASLCLTLVAGCHGNRIVIESKWFIICWCEKHSIVPLDSFNENRWACITGWEPVARRRRKKEPEQQNIRYQQEKAAKAKVRAERRARLRDLGRAGSEIEDIISDRKTSFTQNVPLKIHHDDDIQSGVRNTRH